MDDIAIWVMGVAAVFAVILAQFFLPFAFDFFTTLIVYGVGVYVGRGSKKPRD